MPPVLAQLSTPSNLEVAVWIGCFGGLAGIVLVCIYIFQAIWPRRSPSLEAEFATKAEVAAIEAETAKIADTLGEIKNTTVRLETLAEGVSRQIQQMGAKLDAEADHNATESRNAFHRINAISKESTETRTKVEMLQQQIPNLSKK